MAYSKSELKIHGSGLSYYEGSPAMSINISVSDVSRSGNTISCTVKATLNGLSGSHYFGYNLKVYAQLDNGTKQLIVQKDNSPKQWSSGTYGQGTKTISATNTTTSCKLKIILSSNCPCEQGAECTVQTITMTAPASTYKLTLKKGDGVASFTEEGDYAAGSSASTTAKASPGYQLTEYTGTKADGSSGGKWDDCAGKPTDTQQWKMSCNRTLTVHAEAKEYKLYYHPNGGGTQSITQLVTFGDTVTTKTRADTKFEKSGYTFTGWNTKADGSGTSRNPGSTWKYTTPNSLTLYAQWARIQYTVSYNANGGSNAPSAQKKNSGQNLTLTTDMPTPKAITITLNPNGGSVNPTSVSRKCTFSKWNTKSDGSGDSYSTGGTYKKDQNETLYAIWAGALAGNLPTPTRANHTFVGWYTKSTGGSKVTSTTRFSSNVTVYARWNYTIKYDLNGGLVGEEPYIATGVKQHGVDMKLTTLRPEKEGMEFLGWSENPGASAPTYVSGGTYTEDKSATLYAVYRSKSYRVTFHLNGGQYTGGSLEQYVSYGGSAVPPNDPIHQDKVFKGWLGNYLTVKKDTTIYALWNTSPIWVKKSDGNWHKYVH